MTEETPKRSKENHGFGPDYRERYNLLDDPEQYEPPTTVINMSSHWDEIQDQLNETERIE